MTAAQVERKALDHATVWLRRGRLHVALNILTDAATQMLSTPDAASWSPVWCSWCDGTVVEPVRDGEAVSWLGAGASTYCSKACLDAHDEAAANADGAS